MSGSFTVCALGQIHVDLSMLTIHTHYKHRWTEAINTHQLYDMYHTSVEGTARRILALILSFFDPEINNYNWSSNEKENHHGDGQSKHCTRDAVLCIHQLKVRVHLEFNGYNYAQYFVSTL